MSKVTMYWQPFTNTNGTVDSNVSTSPLAFYFEADVVCIEITRELIGLWLIFAGVKNVEFHHVLATLHQYEWYCQFQRIYLAPGLLCRSWCSAYWDRLGIDGVMIDFCWSQKYRISPYPPPSLIPIAQLIPRSLLDPFIVISTLRQVYDDISEKLKEPCQVFTGVENIENIKIRYVSPTLGQVNSTT